MRLSRFRMRKYLVISVSRYTWLHGSILPVTIPPGNSRDMSSPSVPGAGNCLRSGLVPEGRGPGNSKITPRCSCEVGHFSVHDGAEPRGEYQTPVHGVKYFAQSSGWKNGS